ncbi:MAG: GNAT family N-acetyltransferase [Candidatus Binataceae bacterium]
MAAQPKIAAASPHNAARLSLRPFADAGAAWTDALTGFSGVTLYHGARWLRALVDTYGLKLWVAAVDGSGGDEAACVLAGTRRPFSATRFAALPFSDFCPPLAKSATALATLLDALARDRSTRAGCELRGVAAPAPGRTVDCFANWALDLARPMVAVERSLDRDFRRKIRRGGEAKLTIKRGYDMTFVARFYALQLETRRRLGLPAQPLKFFARVQEVFGQAEDFEVWLASKNGHDLAGAVVLREGGRLYMKWSARRRDEISSANHLLVWSIIEEHAGKVDALDLGRTDVRNQGLSRFKKEAGAVASPLPYSFFPLAPRHVSSEVLTGSRKLVAQAWRYLPLPVARIAGAAVYRFLV